MAPYIRSYTLLVGFIYRDTVPFSLSFRYASQQVSWPSLAYVCTLLVLLLDYYVRASHRWCRGRSPYGGLLVSYA